MTEAQYWDGDSMLAQYYREADKIRRERQNFNLWLQGMYIYDALGRLAPILQGFAKKGTKAKPYVENPYPITEKTKADDRAEKRQMEKNKRAMEQYMVVINQRFRDVGTGRKP